MEQKEKEFKIFVVVVIISQLIMFIIANII